MGRNALDVIQHIQPSGLSYEEWVWVGMALKHEGASALDWEAWSQDDERYKNNECEKKWESFKGSSNPKTIATLVHLAKEQGWKPPPAGDELAWGQTVRFSVSTKKPVESPEEDNLKIIDPNWVEAEELPKPTEDDLSGKSFSRLLSALFSPNEYVGYVVEYWHDKTKDKFSPQRGSFNRTSGELIEEWNKYGELEPVIGSTSDDVGAWVRFNPLDGQGVADKNVTAYRHVLVESDDMPLPEQHALLKKLELPMTAMIFSGGKSIHAIVKVDADTRDEYKKRVDFLFEVCSRNGLKIDRQNRNPSRMTRIPGVKRKGKMQQLLALNAGKASWQEWEEWVIDLNDDLPDIEELVLTDKEPEVAPALIEGLLREGHKMLLSGPSKAHKSFALIQLAISIAEGGKWFGWKTGKGRVLYVNLELDNRSCEHRFWVISRRVYGITTPGTIDIWNLRGHATSLDKLTPKLIRRAQDRGYIAIIIDPIYKVLTGDENSAEQMARFCNQFDMICKQLGVATIFCHHHSKGAQGQKQAQDRSSGSGVFSRDPDTIIDLIELVIDEELRDTVINQWECEALQEALKLLLGDGWEKLIGSEDLWDADKLFAWGCTQAPREELASTRIKARKLAQTASGWRLEPTLREFPPILPKTLFFQYPIHRLDSKGLLADAWAEGEDPPWMKKITTPKEKVRRRREKQEENRAFRYKELELALKVIGTPTKIQEVAEHLACTGKTVRNRVREHPDYMLKNGDIVPTKEQVELGV